jgi:hypothetical protein
MRLVMPTQATAQKRVTNEQVTEALRSLDDSMRNLEKVVLHPGESQTGTAPKSEKTPEK